MRPKPLVSILIPAYNAEAWIAQTIESALAQTWPRKEIIIVDDGSRDQTAAAARRFSSPELRVVTQANQGAAAARNTAWSLAQGDYVQWLDADDLLGPEKVALQMAAAEREDNPRALYSCGWAYFFWRTGRAKFRPSPLWADLPPAEWLRRKMGGGAHMQTATWLVSRELTEAAGPWNISLVSDDDGEYFCRVLLASDGTRFVPGARVFYRISGASQVSYLGQSSRKLEPLWTSVRMHIHYLRSLDDGPASRAACLQYLRRWSAFFYAERPDLLDQAQRLAEQMGGRLPAPAISWKYAGIRKVFGLPAALRWQAGYNLRKMWALKTLDHALFRLEKGRRE